MTDAINRCSNCIHWVQDHAYSHFDYGMCVSLLGPKMDVFLSDDDTKIEYIKTEGDFFCSNFHPREEDEV